MAGSTATVWTGLPADIQATCATSAGKSLEDLQAQLREKPVVKKAGIKGYNGRGAKTVEIKRVEENPSELSEGCLIVASENHRGLRRKSSVMRITRI